MPYRGDVHRTDDLAGSQPGLCADVALGGLRAAVEVAQIAASAAVKEDRLAGFGCRVVEGYHAVGERGLRSVLAGGEQRAQNCDPVQIGEGLALEQRATSN